MPELKKKAGLGGYLSDDNKGANQLYTDMTKGLGAVPKKVKESPAKKVAAKVIDQSKDLDYLDKNAPSKATMDAERVAQKKRQADMKAKKERRAAKKANDA